MYLRQIMGQDIEPYKSVELVEEYRQYWKPKKIRVILLAESHVYTCDEDRQITLPQIPALPGYPTEYAKFVYCLAYGERQFTENNLHPQRDGTPQFGKYSTVVIIKLLIKMISSQFCQKQTTKKE
jgi:hypothetical protein